jgi:hypothetical protein
MRIIRRYSNRKLYDMRESRYTTLTAGQLARSLAPNVFSWPFSGILLGFGVNSDETGREFGLCHVSDCRWPVLCLNENSEFDGNHVPEHHIASAG